MYNKEIDKFIPPFFSAELSYFDSLTKILSEYVEYVKEYIRPDKYVITKIEKINSVILFSIEDLKRANSQSAYERICKIIEEEKIV